MGSRVTPALRAGRPVMNVFVLDDNIELSASYLCDKHIVKMTLETAQLLCTNYYGSPYKPTHSNHPWSRWLRFSSYNWFWLMSYFDAVLNEYSYRYNRVHKCKEVYNWLNSDLKFRDSFVNNDFSKITDMPQCMPPQYYDEDVVKSYRKYYLGEKTRFAKWNYRSEPHWWTSKTP